MTNRVDAKKSINVGRKNCKTLSDGPKFYGQIFPVTTFALQALSGSAAKLYRDTRYIITNMQLEKSTSIDQNQI